MEHVLVSRNGLHKSKNNWVKEKPEATSSLQVHLLSNRWSIFTTKVPTITSLLRVSLLTFLAILACEKKLHCSKSKPLVYFFFHSRPLYATVIIICEK
jgi:hypothetical protein